MATKCCRNLIIDDLLNIVPISDRCPAIIQTVADINDAVAGTVNGQLTVERYVAVDGQHIHLFEWVSGSIWQETVDILFEPSAPFQNYKVTILSGQWEVSFDQGATWVTSDGALPDPVASVETWFRNLENNCVYTNLPEIPLQDYCIDWGVFNVGVLFEVLGTFNGVVGPDQPTMLPTLVAPYQGVQGALGGVQYLGGSDTIYIQVSRPSDQPVTAQLATILDFNGDPVDTTPTDTNCGIECYLTNFTPAGDLDDIEIIGLTINGVAMFFASYFDAYVTQAGVASTIISGLQTYFGIYDPTMTMNIYSSGGVVYFQVSSVLVFTELQWANNVIPADQGTAIVTTCA